MTIIASSEKKSNQNVVICHDESVADAFTPVQTAQHFVDLLYPLPVNYPFNSWQLPSKQSLWFHDSERDLFCSKVVELSEQCVHSYYAVCLPQEDCGDYGRVTKENAILVPGLFCDIDIAGHLTNDGKEPKQKHPPREIALQTIHAMPVEVSFIIESGGGLYPFWLFEKPFEIRDETDRERIKTLLNSWEKLLRSYVQAHDPEYHVDSAAELARVSRMPGSLNNKYKPAYRVQFLDGIIPDAARVHRYTVRELEGWIDELKEKQKRPSLRFESTHEEDVSKALSALYALDSWRADPYEDWIAVGMALHSVDASLLHHWEQWSRKSGKYKDGDCEKHWKTFNGNTSGKDRTIASLIKWAKEDGWNPPDKFKGASPPPVRKPNPNVSDDTLIDLLREKLHLPSLTGVIKRGKKNPDYELAVEGRDPIVIGKAAKVLSVACVRERLFDECGHLIGMDKRGWPDVALAIRTLAVECDLGDDDLSQLREWIDRLLEKFPADARAYDEYRNYQRHSKAWEYHVAVQLMKNEKQYGWYLDGERLIIREPKLRSVVNDEWLSGERVTRPSMCMALSRAGFSQFTLAAKIQPENRPESAKDRLQVRLWQSPEGYPREHFPHLF